MLNKEININIYVNWDEKAFHLLYRQYYKALVNYAQQITGNQLVSEDLVQDVITILWEDKLQFPTVISLEVFLYNSVRNASIDWLRHRNVETNYVTKITEKYREYRLENESALFDEEVYRMLFKTIDELPKRSREVMLLQIKGKKNQEIADELGITYETVKTHKKKAMTILRKKLNDDDFLLLAILLSCHQFH